MTAFCEVAYPSEIPKLAALAREIWTECYSPLLASAQIEYMLEHFQSEQPMRHQLAEEHYRYFFLKFDEQDAGYLGIQLKDNALFLSKLYIRHDFRGLGIARDVMAFLEGWMRGAKLSRIWLTVNRGNQKAIQAYESMGFQNIGTQDADIGSGYIMDDYLFEKKSSQNHP